MSVPPSPYAYLVLREALNKVLGVQERVLAVHTLQALKWGGGRRDEEEGEIEDERGPEAKKACPRPDHPP